VPRRQEHLKAARALLGYADPLVHVLMDRALERLGPRHRYVSHNAEYIQMIRALLGEEAGLEATLHLLQDWGLVESQDYAFYRPPRSRRKGR